MIITSTPYRISFFGGGTDYPVWFNEHGGAVLATSINRYCYIHCRFAPPFFDFLHRIVWSQIEQVQRTEDIKHPAVREAIRHLKIEQGLEIHHDGDLPARTGLGSSSAFAVGILHSLYALKNEMASKHQLATEAIYLERELLHDNVGIQDQISTAYGGLNLIEIDRGGAFQVRPIPLSTPRRQRLEEHMLLVYTGIARNASQVAAKQIEAIPDKTAVLERMQSMVYEAAAALTGNGDLEEFGTLLDETWHLKRSISPEISTPLIDDLYGRAKKAGASGGKLLGAGGGGFILLFVAPKKRQAVLDALRDYLVVPFELESRGTHVVLYEPDQYSQLAQKVRDFLRVA